LVPERTGSPAISQTTAARFELGTSDSSGEAQSQEAGEYFTGESAECLTVELFRPQIIPPPERDEEESLLCVPFCFG